MKALQLVAEFERMLNEHWAYEWGAAREGVVDCSGAFVWAFKQFGQSIYHGSNTIARQYIIGGMQPIAAARPGWAVFKRRFDGEEPEKYQSDGLGNFYHIGLCSRDEQYALDAKGVKYGFVSEKIGAFQFAAMLKGVDYSDEQGAGGGMETQQKALYQARVTTQQGPLRIRQAPVSGEVLGTIPKGALVDILQEGDWPMVRFGGITGYSSGEYLTRVTPDDPPGTEASDSAGGARMQLELSDENGSVWRPEGKISWTFEQP